MNYYRSIFISDLHLGTRGCDVDHLLSFLKNNTADTLYLVGDIIDFWALSRKVYFPPKHLEVLQLLVKISKKKKVVYVTGNHDEPLRHFTPFSVGNIEIVDEAFHASIDGDKVYSVVHGDKYDQIFRYARWLAWAGDIGYHFLLRSNRVINKLRGWVGLKPWSLSAFIKNKVKGAVQFIGRYEETVAADIKRQGLDGVICGHIHHAEIKEIDGIIYMNDGDFVESCTALVETLKGEFKIKSML